MNKFKFLPFMAAAAVITGCQEYDLGLTAADVSFRANFAETFGNVDPTHNWVALDGGNVEVSVHEDSHILIYAEGLSSKLLLREVYIQAGGTMNIGYDAPAGVTEVTIVAKSANDWQAETIAVASQKSISFYSKATRSAVATYTAQPRRKIDFVGGSYTVNGGETAIKDFWNGNHLNPITRGSSLQYPASAGWGAYYAINEWPLTNDAEYVTDAGGLKGDGTMSLPYTEITLNEAQSKAVQAAYGSTEGTTNLKQYTQDFSIKTTKPGPISLTYVYGYTVGKGALGYCYTKENTPDAVKAAPKYLLFVNEQDLAPGQQYHLTFYGEDGTGNPTLEFPKDYYINFFVLTSADGTGLQAWHVNKYRYVSDRNDSSGEWKEYYSYFDDVYGMNNAHLAIYSQESLNGNVASLIGSDTGGGVKYQCASTAAWSTMGFNCLSFEDYPDRDAVNSDWNDICFLFDANTDDFESIDESIDYMVACEDLGNTFDFDYNDIVFKVSHLVTINGSTTTYHPLMKVTLMAAGGTLPAKVWYDVDNDGECGSSDIVFFQEVHSAFGVEQNVPVNVGGVSKTAVTYSVSLEELFPGDDNAASKATAWRIADNASRFKVTISNPLNDGDVTTGDETTVYKVRDIAVPEETGSIPSAFIIPSSSAKTWQWPNENVRINTVYPTWDSWVESRTEGAKWYDEGAWWGTSGSNPSIDPTEPEALTETKNASQSDVSNNILSKEFFLSELGDVTKSTITLTATTDATFYIKDGDQWALPTIKSQSEGVLTSGVSNNGNLFIPAGGSIVFEISSNLSYVKKEGWYIEEKTKYEGSVAYPAQYNLTIVNTYTEN